MQLPVYFFGDNHFSINSLSNKEKIKKFEDFYHLIKNEKCSIVIMGDFFDYYFEYNNSKPDYFNEVFDLLKRIKESKIDIYFVAGNHDYWIGDYFKSYTKKTFLNDTEIQINNKSIYLTHGDGILSWDKSYRVLKKIIRSSIFIIIYSLIPKKYGNKIAEKISYKRKDSHKRDIKKLNKIHDELINFSKEKWSTGTDCVIMGHYHHDFSFTENGKELYILDDCSENSFNYLKYDGSSFIKEKI